MKKIHVGTKILTCCSFAMALILSMPSIPAFASEETQPTDETLPNEAKEGYFPYTAVDRDGNVEVKYLPEVDESEILKQQEKNADGYQLVLTIGNRSEVIAEYDTKAKAEQAQTERMRLRSPGKVEIQPLTDYSDIAYGVVNFRTKSSSETTSFIETGTNASGYLHGASAPDGAFLGYCDINQSKIKFRQSGVEGCVSAKDVVVYDYDDVNSVNFYRVENGTIYHYLTTDVNSKYYTSTLNVGPAQSYMKSNVVYYSYDGHYFYTSYEKMIDDYKKNTYANSINPTQPYYNYYQFLSHRTKTTVTAAQMDAYTNTKVKSGVTSKMRDMGKYFLESQNTYGANALLVYGVAANESFYGTSSIALTKNNLFGHNAVDSDTSQANTYSAPQVSIQDHAKNFVSDGYLDPKDYAGRYRGGHLGNKASGMNVKYASDPYWGEKAAAVAYALTSYAKVDEFGKYTIGTINKLTNLNIRKDAASSSTSLYMSGGWQDYTVVVLEQSSGESVNGNRTWYRIQSDPTLNADRTATTQGTYTYDYNKYYGYVSSYYVNVVKYTNKDATIPGDGENTTNYKLGDVNGDGKITSMDYVLVKNHILNISKLSGDKAKAADVNQDGKISSMDYVLIKNHILGITTIKWG